MARLQSGHEQLSGRIANTQSVIVAITRLQSVPSHSRLTSRSSGQFSIVDLTTYR
jgi:hypothetical protein